jgi:hypothetical protein
MWVDAGQGSKCLTCKHDKEPPVLKRIIHEDENQTVSYSPMEVAQMQQFQNVPVEAPTKTERNRVLDGDTAHRKQFPMATGLLDYFPDALAEVAKVSKAGNDKHNPGEPLHHARGKSMDHADCIMRHLAGRGGFDGETRESASLAWRALALLQEELEREYGLPLPRGAKQHGGNPS